MQRRVGAGCENKVDILREVLHKELHRLAAPIVGRELVVVEHQGYLLRHLAKLVDELGNYGVDDARAGDVQSRKGAAKPFPRHTMAQRFDDMPPQPDRIVVLLVQGDPGESAVSLFRTQPLGQEDRLAVAGRSADEVNLAVEPRLEHPQ